MVEINNLEYEENGIGIRNEGALHLAIKKWYGMPGDRFEVKVDGSIIDIVRGKQLIEIQTKNFKAISSKISRLLNDHRVVLVHPIPMEKWITTTNESGEIIRRRKSPKRGQLSDIFKELVSIPNLINNENFSIEVLITKEEELRCDDGNGSWRRKGVRIVNRNLICVIEKVTFNNRKDFMIFLPQRLPLEFTNKNLAEALEVSVEKSRRATYCLKKMGLICECGKKGRELLFTIVKE